MKRTHQKIFPTLLIAAAGAMMVQPAHGAEGQPRVRKKASRKIANIPSDVRTETQARDLYINEQTGTGFTLFLGVGAGSLSVNPNADTGGLKSSGSAIFGRSAVAFHNRNFAIELGLNWMQGRVTGDAITVVNGTTRATQTELFTRAAILEFSPRFRLTNKLEFGPVGSAFFGSQATFGGPSEGGVHTPIFLGAKATATFGAGNLPIRFVAQAAHSLSIPDRGVWVISAGLEVGLPIFRGRTVVRERETLTVRNNYEREIIEREKVVVRRVAVEKPVIQEKIVIQERVVFSFDDQIVNFEFDKATLMQESREFMHEFGMFLASRPDVWASLKIEGHTDTRGSDEYNQRLAEGRVGTVRDVLTGAGVPAERIEAIGVGESRPIDPNDSEIAHARNRRVEMSFTGVSDPQALRDAVNKIKLKYYKPATCNGGVCR